MRLLRRRSIAWACCAASPLIGKLTACPRPSPQSLWENTDWLRARSTAVSCRHWMVGGHPPTRAMHRSWNCAPALPHLVVRDQHFRGRNVRGRKGSVAPAKTQARPLNEATPLTPLSAPIDLTADVSAGQKARPGQVPGRAFVCLRSISRHASRGPRHIFNTEPPPS